MCLTLFYQSFFEFHLTRGDVWGKTEVLVIGAFWVPIYSMGYVVNNVLLVKSRHSDFNFCKKKLLLYPFQTSADLK